MAKSKALKRSNGSKGSKGSRGATGSRAKKFVYFFGNGKADGNRSMKDTLGGKGAGLAEMTNAGLPVPAGFTISTDACNI
jgi:pyruvate, orthophosphate dikinase